MSRRKGFWELFTHELFTDKIEIDMEEFEFLLDSVRYLNTTVNQLLYTQNNLTEEDYKKLNGNSNIGFMQILIS